MCCKKWLSALVLAGVLSLQTGLARADPEVGWWWNPNESGRGFFIESQNGIVYLAGYFYEADGRARWLVAGGPNADPNSYLGRLLAYSNGQTLLGDYKPPSVPTDEGEVSLHFTDDRHGTLTWPGGTIPIERETFDTATAAFQPNTGWWWNEAESGRGYSVEVQGNNIFVVSFMYDDSGKPVWYYSAGRMSSPTTYEGEWLQFANGQTLTGTYHPPTAPVTVGQLTMEFTAADEATLTIESSAIASGAIASGTIAKVRKPIKLKREFKSKPNKLPEQYTGVFSQTTDVKLDLEGAAKYVSKETLVGILTWVKDELAQRLASNVYVPFVGSITVSFESSLTSMAAICLGTGKPVIVFFLSENGSYLEVSGYSQYAGVIKHLLVPYDVHVICKNGEGTVVSDTTFTHVGGLDIPMKGIVVDGKITGMLPPVETAPGSKVSSDWNFAPVP